MFRRFAGAAVAILSAALPAFAQGDYPARTVTMIVPFPPGGVADITARPVARVETPPQYLDQPQFRAFWDADAKKLAEVVKKIGKVE